VRLKVRGTAAFPSLLRLRSALESVPANTSTVIIDLSETILVDHTFLSGIASITQERVGTTISIRGHDHLTAASDHPQATRWVGAKVSAA